MAMSQSDPVSDEFDLVAAVGPACRRELAEVARVVEVEAGAVVQTAGGPSTRLLLVSSGSLHVIHSNSAGHRQIIRILGRGDHYGLVECALPGPARYRVETAEDSVLTEIHFDALQAIADRHPDLQRAITTALARKTAESEHLLVSLTSEDVMTRIVSYLLSLPRIRNRDGRVSVRLPVTQNDLASHLGTTPETLSRRLRELMDAGAITRAENREFTLRYDLLADY
ncbi:MAG TPA: Crp/Fnr family transcriptional regulator [Candidatus Dietzia intestinigallinarum]|nr:Crp/Fnr family transcriptional regulator [Candidatus Dietzia intestinigallinarum]